MTGTWAREADHRARFVRPDVGLERAAHHLACALTGGTSYMRLNPASFDGTVEHHLMNASAIIRRERRRLDPKGISDRHGDPMGEYSDESLIWRALRLTAAAHQDLTDQAKAWHLRAAEAALRTLHKRGEHERPAR